MDIGELISSLSPEDINQLKSVAGAVLGQNEASGNGENRSADTAALIKNISRLTGGLREEDDRIALMKALKPLLSESKRHKADDAIKLLRLIQMVPLLRDSGFLKEIL